MKYFASRFVQTCLLLVGVSILSFLLVDLAPGSFFDEMRLNPQISSETVSNLRIQYGLNRPLPVRYLHWLRSVAKGEFGYSFAYNAPVAPLLWTRSCNTLLLTGSATLLTWMLALPLGVLCAEKRGGWFDYAASAVTSALLATPDLLLALGLLLLAARTRWLPVGGMASPNAADHGTWEHWKSTVSHLVGPLMVLSLGALPVVTRHVRAAMLEAMGTPFIRAARAHGIARFRVLFRHALPAASSPLVSLFALYFGSLLSASLLIEVVMGWPGLGPLLVEAILARDFYVVIGTVIFAALFFVGGAFIGDALLFAVDPRIRIEKLT